MRDGRILHPTQNPIILNWKYLLYCDTDTSLTEYLFSVELTIDIVQTIPWVNSIYCSGSKRVHKHHNIGHRQLKHPSSIHQPGYKQFLTRRKGTNGRSESEERSGGMLRRRKLRKVCLGRANHACVSLADSAQTAWLSITSRSHQLFVVSGNVTRSGIVVTHVPQQSKMMTMSTILYCCYNIISITTLSQYFMYILHIDSLVMPFIKLIRSSNLPIFIRYYILHKTKIHIK